MTCKLRIHYHGAFYHLILRGISGQDIFFRKNDRTKFYLLLQEGIERYVHRILFLSPTKLNIAERFLQAWCACFTEGCPTSKHKPGTLVRIGCVTYHLANIRAIDNYKPGGLCVGNLVTIEPQRRAAVHGYAGLFAPRDHIILNDADRALFQANSDQSRIIDVVADNIDRHCLRPTAIACDSWPDGAVIINHVFYNCRMGRTINLILSLRIAPFTKDAAAGIVMNDITDYC